MDSKAEVGEKSTSFAVYSFIFMQLPKFPSELTYTLNSPQN